MGHLQEAYEMLVSALEREAELGECVEIIEAELAKKPLPGDVNNDYRKVRRSVHCRTIGQRYGQATLPP